MLRTKYLDPKNFNNVPRENKASVIHISEKLIDHIEERKKDFKWKIRDFEIGCRLGKGKYGHVYLAREKETEFLVALKVMNKKSLAAENMEKQALREVSIHAKLKHPNIISLYTCFVDKSRLYLVMEFAPNGTLYNKLEKLKTYSPGTVAKYMYQVADAVDYCHSMKVIHRDIKPENILVDVFGKIKVSDFGWAVKIGERKRKTMCGTVDYLSPEIVNNEEYGKEVDNWSIGVLCFELLAGYPPFQSSSKETTFDKITTVSVNYPVNKIPVDAKEMITKLLQLKPNKRISLDAIKKHKWIQSYYKP